MSWREMAVEGLEATPCSRKANQKANKRGRIITIDNVMETVTFTSTSTITESDWNTATFSVSVRLWLAGGFFVNLKNFLIPARQLHPCGLHICGASVHRSSHNHRQPNGIISSILGKYLSTSTLYFYLIITLVYLLTFTNK